MKKPMTYMDSVHRDGRIWNLSVMVLLLAFPVAVCLIFGVMPQWNSLLMGLIATAPMYWAVGAIETVTCATHCVEYPTTLQTAMPRALQ